MLKAISVVSNVRSPVCSSMPARYKKKKHTDDGEEKHNEVEQFKKVRNRKEH